MQDVGQGHALPGALAAGRAGRGQVGRLVGGELADHRLQVAADRLSKVTEVDDLTVAIELDLRHHPLHDPLDQVGKARGDRPGDRGDLGRQDRAPTAHEITAGPAHRLPQVEATTAGSRCSGPVCASSSSIHCVLIEAIVTQSVRRQNSNLGIGLVVIVWWGQPGELSAGTRGE
jgi:hypothetical protein